MTQTPRPPNKKLQALIDRAANAASLDFKATSALNKYCTRVYGYAPSDVDADEIIDSVLGGCGMAPGMSADRFHEVMVENNPAPDQEPSHD
jgi:hypothetical protein